MMLVPCQLNTSEGTHSVRVVDRVCGSGDEEYRCSRVPIISGAVHRTILATSDQTIDVSVGHMRMSISAASHAPFYHLFPDVAMLPVDVNRFALKTACA